MPMVGKENPRGEKKSVLLAPSLDYPRQDFEIVVVKPILGSEKVAGHEEVALRKNEPAQA